MYNLYNICSDVHVQARSISSTCCALYVSHVAFFFQVMGLPEGGHAILPAILSAPRDPSTAREKPPHSAAPTAAVQPPTMATPHLRTPPPPPPPLTMAVQPHRMALKMVHRMALKMLYKMALKMATAAAAAAAAAAVDRHCSESMAARELLSTASTGRKQKNRRRALHFRRLQIESGPIASPSSASLSWPSLSSRRPTSSSPWGLSWPSGSSTSPAWACVSWWPSAWLHCCTP